MHPGAIVLHNYPRYLQRFTAPRRRLMDLAATDILRTRELRRAPLQRVPPPAAPRRRRRFEDLTANPGGRAAARGVHGDLERVDLMVGMFAERRPEGFAFSDTAFRIFILMASRRLNSDRFFTTDYTPEVYTPEGMAGSATTGWRRCCSATTRRCGRR